MGLGSKRSQSSCFCNIGCPKGTYPFEQYWVSAFSPVQPSYSDDTYLYRFVTSTETACQWEAVQSHFNPPGVEQLTKQVITAPGGLVIGYEWRLLLVSTAGAQNWRLPVLGIGGSEGLIDPEAPDSCSRVSVLVPNELLGEAAPCFLDAAYPNACDDDDWPAKRNTKIVQPY